MQSIQLPDPLYQAAQRRALEAGYASVEQYIAQVISSEMDPEADNFDKLFTSDRLSKLDDISQRLQQGEATLSDCDIDDHFNTKRATWLKNQA